jgi:predicted AAA+ superfamily ATPase
VLRGANLTRDRDIFDIERLPPSLDAFLRDTNPWWAGKPGRVLPTYRRWAFRALRSKLASGLAAAVVIRGPRQVGKTTLQEQLVRELIDQDGVDPRRVLRVQFDEIPSLRGLKEPVLSIARWYQDRILGETFNEAAHARRPAVLLLDEVQNLPDWATQLKALVDHSTVKVVVTGSSSLRIEAGRDSLAGRITTIDLGTLLLREIAGLRLEEKIDPLVGANGLSDLTRIEFWRELVEMGADHREARDEAFALFSERGGYPVAHANPNVPWEEIADQLNENVIQRAIRHDLRMGSRGRKRDENLLEEVFRLACRYAGQAPGRAVLMREVREALQADVGWNRIRNYLNFLDGALLIKLIRPRELRLKRRQGNAKLCLCDHGLRASWLQESIPIEARRLRDRPDLSDLAGHLAESVVGYWLAGLTHLDVAHFPERAAEPEVDFVLTVGDKRVPVEVKYRQRIDPHRDTLGLRAFVEKAVYNAPCGVLVTMHDGVDMPDPRIIAVSLPSLLLMR